MGIKKIRKTREQFISGAISVHGDRYDYSLVEYTTQTTNIQIVCREHGPFWQRPLNHLHNHGCPACVKCKRTTLEDFLVRSKKSHGDKYDYSLVEYKKVDGKVKIICHEHGEFQQMANSHMLGRGCIKCGAAKAPLAIRHTIERFILEARLLHGDKFDYSRASYISSVTPIEIICPYHGPFWQVPQDHKTRYGCQACAGLLPVTANEFLLRARKTHGDLYAYDITTFSRYRSPVKIICNVHGSFSQIPKEHIEGSGCPKCARERTSSKEEREVADWLQSIGELVTRNDREALDGFEIDIFLPDLKFGIEYNGSYWHQDEKMVHPRIHETKALRAEKFGVRLITVWDFDWKNNQDLVKLHILHAIGKNSGEKINARSCLIQKISFKIAKKFYEHTHIQGAPGGAMIHYGMFFGDRIVACMSFGKGGSRRGKTGNDEWELMRFSTHGLVRGGAGKLFANFIEEINPSAIWSFSDRQHFSGGIYLSLGFSNDGNVKSDYRVFHQNKNCVWHKSAWQRKHIQARLLEIGSPEIFDCLTDQRSERDMQKLVGAIRIMDSGKVRWKWERKNAQ